MACRPFDTDLVGRAVSQHFFHVPDLVVDARDVVGPPANPGTAEGAEVGESEATGAQAGGAVAFVEGEGGGVVGGGGGGGEVDGEREAWG